MKYWLVIFLIFISINVFSESANYGVCGKKAGFLERLVTDSEKIRLKCIEDVYKEYEQKRLEEVDSLSKYSKKLDDEIKKYAEKYSAFVVNCGNEYAKDNSKVLKCKKAVAEQRAVISRIDQLMGWDEKFKTSKQSTSVNSTLSPPPCPSESELKKMQGVRYFNKKLYQTWERCKVLNPN